MKSTEIKFTAIPSTEEVKAERDRLVKLGQEVDRIKAGLTKTG